MFRQIAGFEFRYHVRSPLFWVTDSHLRPADVRLDRVRQRPHWRHRGKRQEELAVRSGRDAADHGHLRGVHHGGVRVERRRPRRRDGIRTDCPLDPRLQIRLPVRPVHGSVRGRVRGIYQRPAGPAARIGHAMARSRDAGAISTGRLSLRLLRGRAAHPRGDGGILLRARDDHALDVRHLHRPRRDADDLFRVRGVLVAPRIRAHRGADRSVRRGGVRLRDEVLDRGRAQHPAARDCRPDPVEPRHLVQRRLRLPDRRLAALSSRTQGRQQVQKAGSRTGGAARTRSGYQPPAGEAATRCRNRPNAAPGAGAVRHEGGLPKPGILRPARHRLHQFDWRPVVRQPGSVRERVLPRDAPDDSDAQRGVHADPVDRGDLLRRRARLARARTADPGTGRCDTGPRVDVRASESAGDYAGPAGNGCRRNSGRYRRPDFQRIHALRARELSHLVRPALDDRRHAARRPRPVHSGARAAQVRGLAGDAGGDRVADRARPARLRAQSLSICGRPGRSAVRHERPGSLSPRTAPGFARTGPPRR